MTGPAGKRLRADLDAALARESDKLGGAPLRWDEREQQHIDAAMRAADHVAKLERILNAELAREEVRPTALVKLAGEIRLQDRAIGEHLGHLKLDEFAPSTSAQHRAAARARWGADRAKLRGA
jgi:hypothetical protein